MKNTLRIAAVFAAALAWSGAARADSPEESSPWLVRLRGTYLSMANESDPFSALGLYFPGNAVRVDSKWIPEFDVSYSFTPNWVAELVLTVPQTQAVSLQGVGNLGSFKHLPPVLSGQYHFLPRRAIDPYLGLGVNYTLIFDTDLHVADVPLTLGTHSFGVSGEAGVDIRLGQGWYFNIDAKKVTLASDVDVGGGTYLTRARLDPLLLSFGLGYRF